MCYGRCARCIGHALVWLAVLCIVANILLYFPNGDTRYASEDHLSRFVRFFSGIGGGGVVVSHAASRQLKQSLPLDGLFPREGLWGAWVQSQWLCAFLSRKPLAAGVGLGTALKGLPLSDAICKISALNANPALLLNSLASQLESRTRFLV